MNKAQLLTLSMVGFLVACSGTADEVGFEGDEDIGSAEEHVIVGTVDWSSATTLTGAKADRAKAVGYLSIPSISSRCTAWLVSEDLVITNNHCIGSSGQAAGAKVAFNYDDNTNAASRVWYDCSTFVQTWANLDMTALRCSPVNGVLPGVANGYLRVAGSDAPTNESIYVLHQNCDYYTSPSCSPTKKYSPGFIMNGNYSMYDASYNADTLGGSSGSPVLSASGNEVVALHHYGFNKDYMGRGTYNSGVCVSHIRAALCDVGVGCPVYL
jgi:V8-like Glu-specific endopeptidase